MPIYPFICPKCKGTIETFFHSSAYHEVNCPHCGTPMDKHYQKMIPAVIYEENDSINYDLDHKPIVYHTKGQLKRIAKEHGCHMRD